MSMVDGRTGTYDLSLNNIEDSLVGGFRVAPLPNPNDFIFSETLSLFYFIF